MQSQNLDFMYWAYLKAIADYNIRTFGMQQCMHAVALNITFSSTPISGAAYALCSLGNTTGTSQKIWISWKWSIFFVTHFRKWNPYIISIHSLHIEWNISRFSMRFRSGEFAGQLSTVTPWSFNQLLVLLAVLAGAKSCWKMKSASP